MKHFTVPLRRGIGLAALVCACSLAIGTARAIPPAENDAAPSLSDIELGHLRYFVTLARQDLDDWTGWYGSDQKSMEAYRYQIAFMTYALALQQYHSLPAYRDLYQDTINRLISRMLEKPVWAFWETVSTTDPSFDPDWEGPAAGTKDPVGEKDIMYSGHVIHMIALYEMLYRDLEWSKPDALTFRWNSDLAFRYDYSKLVDIIHNEMMTPRREGSRDIGAMECEPNAVFPECNQHPTLAFMLFDDLRGTSYARITKTALKSFFENTQMYHPETEHAAAFYMVKQDHVLRIPMVNSASADGWTGAFMHAWDPDYIESIYEKQRDDYISRDPKSGAVRLAPDPSAALGPAFFANLAVEVGDLKTADALFEFADARYASTWDKDGFHYEYNKEDKRYPVTNTTDRLMALARSNRPYGLWKLHNRPWGKEDFSYPRLQKVDFPKVLVRQAYWDAGGEALRVAIEPGTKSELETTIQFSRLDSAREYTLYRDHTAIGRIHRGTRTEGAGLKTMSPGTVELALHMSEATALTLRAE